MSESPKSAWAFLPVLTGIVGVMALVAVLRLPYGYYRLLRLAVLVAAVGLVLKGPRRHQVPVILLALLFNPLVPVHLPRVLWAGADLGLGLYFLYLASMISEAS